MNLKRYWSFIIYGTYHPEELAEIEDMRFKYNYRILWISGLFFIAMLAGAIVTLLAKGGDLSYLMGHDNIRIYVPGLILMIGFTALEHFADFNNHRKMFIAMMYLKILVIYSIIILLGTKMIPEANAVLFFMVLIMEPAIFSDHPWRTDLFTLISVLLFLNQSHHFKEPRFFQMDIVSAVTAILIVVFVSATNQHTRINSWINSIRIQGLSEHDSLTGLYNRQAFDMGMKCGFSACKDIAFVMCDLNGLKLVNDSKGHAEGDRLLKKGAEILTSVFGDGNVYRLGGDEFFVALADKSNGELSELIETLRADERQNNISFALGAAHRTAPFGNLKELYKEADEEMYLDKEKYYREKAHNRRKSK
ncbi:GGDEF domain-containing protein [Butyrivibrio sp. LC3010]|uniref:GGDEF domain-containing protein n=1 Tax=Butyrivibrio sp. LC3010 TaxID=1280680 RepID=UPI000422AFB0|nr:GGDEF domain-containing protein [Butyrivibrio sp. LC3010]